MLPHRDTRWVHGWAYRAALLTILEGLTMPLRDTRWGTGLGLSRIAIGLNNLYFSEMAELVPQL